MQFIDRFHIRIGAFIDDVTVTLMGPEPVLSAFVTHACELGIFCQSLHMDSKVHNPENGGLADKLRHLCHHHPGLALRDSDIGQGKVRSNVSGQVISKDSVTDQVIDTILRYPCQWQMTMANVAKPLLLCGRTSHIVAQFGFADIVPTSVFQNFGLKLKIACMEPGEVPTSLKPNHTNLEKDSLDSVVEPIAVVGMACRIPGAEDVQQLWEVVHSGKCMAMEVPKTLIDIQERYRAEQDAKWMSGRKFFGNFISDVDAFDNGFFSISAREASTVDPQQRLLLETTFQAVESSGYLHAHQSQRGDPVGVFIGASFVD